MPANVFVLSWLIDLIKTNRCCFILYEWSVNSIAEMDRQLFIVSSCNLAFFRIKWIFMYVHVSTTTKRILSRVIVYVLIWFLSWIISNLNTIDVLNKFKLYLLKPFSDNILSPCAFKIILDTPILSVDGFRCWVVMILRYEPGGCGINPGVRKKTLYV